MDARPQAAELFHSRSSLQKGRQLRVNRHPNVPRYALEVKRGYTGFVKRSLDRLRRGIAPKLGVNSLRGGNLILRHSRPQSSTQAARLIYLLSLSFGPYGTPLRLPLRLCFL